MDVVSGRGPQRRGSVGHDVRRARGVRHVSMGHRDAVRAMTVWLDGAIRGECACLRWQKHKTH